MKFGGLIGGLIGLLVPCFAFGQSDLPILVQLKPVSETILSAEMQGRLVSLLVEEGDSVVSGQTLGEIACAEQRGRLSSFEAAVEAAELELEATRQLQTYNSATELQVQIREAAVSRAVADAAVQSAMVERCVIAAPFDGRVSNIEVFEHQYLGEGQPIFEVIDDSSLKASFLAPSDWLSWLAIGDEMSIRVIETGTEELIRISRIGVRVDPISRSVRIEATLPKVEGRLLAGMSAQLLPRGE